MNFVLNHNKFNELIKRQGYSSTAEFLEHSGLHRNTLGKYLRGELSVFTAGYLRICISLECSPLELITERNQGIRKNSIEGIRSILEQALSQDSEVSAMLIGSRASGKAHEFSDWDIALTRGRAGLSTEDYLRLKESILVLADDLPVGVDVLNLDQAPAWFLNELRDEPLFLYGNEANFHYFQGILDGTRKNKSSQAAA